MTTTLGSTGVLPQTTLADTSAIANRFVEAHEKLGGTVSLVTYEDGTLHHGYYLPSAKNRKENGKLCALKFLLESAGVDTTKLDRINDKPMMRKMAAKVFNMSAENADHSMALTDQVEPGTDGFEILKRMGMQTA